MRLSVVEGGEIARSLLRVPSFIAALSVQKNSSWFKWRNQLHIFSLFLPSKPSMHSMSDDNQQAPSSSIKRSFTFQHKQNQKKAKNGHINNVASSCLQKRQKLLPEVPRNLST
jgi:hypothetical protein